MVDWIIRLLPIADGNSQINQYKIYYYIYTHTNSSNKIIASIKVKIIPSIKI